MKKITLFLVAIFAMVHMANAQRAWAYDLGLTSGSESYTFTFKAVTAANATLVFYRDGVEAATLDLGSVAAGQNTVTKTSDELLSTIQKSGDFTWGVKMTGEAVTLDASNFTREVTDGSKDIYKFYLPQGVVVDNNPESSAFGKIFVAAATDGASNGGSDRADKQKRGIFVYDQALNELNPTSNVGIIPSNVTLSDASRQAMHRIAVNPVNNHIAFAYNVSGSPAVWSVPANNPAGEATNLIAGTAITMPNSICFDENGALYVMDNANATTGGAIYKVVEGVATKIAQNTTWQYIDNCLAYDGRGGIWIAQSHDNNTWPSYEILSHVNSSGEIDWKSSDYKNTSLFSNGNSGGYSKRGQCAYSTKDQLLAFAGNKRSHIFQVTYDESTGAPSLGTIYKYRTPFLNATNVDGLAFDYAGDLYLMSAGAERMYKYAVPTTNNTCTTPAPKAQTITLEATIPEYNVTININGEGEVTGASTGSYMQGSELTLTATPAAHYDFVNWTYGSETSTDNPLTVTVDGDKTITANFAKKNYTLTVFTNDEDKGTIDVATGSHEAGTEVTLTATPKAGYKLLYWSDRSKENPRTVTMNQNESLSAYFVKEYANDPIFAIEKVWENTNVPTATTNGFQAVGWGGNIYMKDRYGAAINVYTSSTESSLFAATDNILSPTETHRGDQAIAVDDAGNLILRSGSSLFYNSPKQVIIYKKGETTYKTIDFVLPATGRCDFISASGNVFSERGGYVYFYCQNQTTVSRLFIKNGGATTEDISTDNVGVGARKGTTESHVMLDIFGNIVINAKVQGIKAEVINVLTDEVKQFNLPNLKSNTLGGCTFELGGKEFWAYNVGETSWSSEWTLYNITDDKSIADETFFITNKTSTNASANWLNVQVEDDKTAYIYQFCPKVGVAVWKVTAKETFAVTATTTNGTVTGAGNYEEGATATLTATPNTGYKFVSWTKNGEEVSTNAIYEFTVTENVNLVANFAVQERTSRAWAYNMKLREDGDNYTFTFKATTAGEATITFQDKDGNALAQPASQTMTAVKGENKFTIAKTDFAEGVDAFWSITMDGDAIGGVVEATDQSRGIYDFYSMMGVIVDNNTDSKDFGKIYIQQSYQRSYATSEAKNNGITTRSNEQTSGIFIYNQDLEELNNPSNVGYKPTMPSGYTEIGSSSSAFQRLNIHPKTGNLVFSHAIAGKPSVFAINRDDMTGAVTNLLTGVADMTRSVAHCFDAEGKLYVMDFADSKGAVYEVVNGNANRITEISSKFINASITMASDGRGGLWISQNRGQMDGAPYYYQLVHVSSNGEFDWAVNKETPHGFEGSSSRGALAYDVERQILAQGRNGKVELYTVSYEPTITLTPLHTITSDGLGNNIDGLAFDYAGDLYVVNSSKEKFQKFTLPTADNICTVAAPSSEAIRFTPVYTVSVESNNNEWGIVSGGGTFEEDQTATITATAATNYKFVNWAKGDVEVSTDATYSFPVKETATYTANFVEKTKHTIEVTISEDDKMGTVIGAGTYYEGTEVTLTAKANSGYVFVDWSDGSTEETRTFTAGVDLPETLTANFKIASPRAWAYDLKKGEDTDNYTFTFTVTSEGIATILFTDENGKAVAPTQENVGEVTAGETKTVTIAKTQFTGEKDIYWSVKVEGNPITKMAEVTNPTLGLYDIVCPQGVAVDNNPYSEYFGQIYVAAATDGTTGRGNQTRGIFVYNQALEELNTPNAGYLPDNATLTNTTRQAIHRVAVNPVNNHVAFAYNLSSSSAVWSMDPENLSGNAINLIEGAGITKANSICFDENGALYVMDNANIGSVGGNIYKIENNTKTLFAAHQSGYQWAVEDNAMTPDGRGGLWIAQNRWSVDGYPVLSHVNANGQVDFAVSQYSSAELQALFPYDDNNASYRGQCAYYVADDILAFAGNKEAVLFKVTYDANNTPTNLEKLMSTGKLGANIDGVAFDYAGDLYVASETTHRFYKFVIPTDNNTCTTPARQKVINNVKLYDNVDNQAMLSTLSDNLTENVAVYRSLTAGMYNTLCLPFDVATLTGTPLENTTVWQYKGATVKGSGDYKEIFLDFTEVDSIVAGQPYLVEPTEDIEAPMEFRGVKISAIEGYAVGSFEAVTMQGVLHPTELQANDKSILFLVANNELAWANVTANMNGMRAYFKVNEPSLQSARTRAYIKRTPTVATSMENTEYNKQENNTRKIIYNNTIYILRGDEVYTIQGTKVK